MNLCSGSGFCYTIHTGSSWGIFSDILFLPCVLKILHLWMFRTGSSCAPAIHRCWGEPTQSPGSVSEWSVSELISHQLSHTKTTKPSSPALPLLAHPSAAAGKERGQLFHPHDLTAAIPAAEGDEEQGARKASLPCPCRLMVRYVVRSDANTQILSLALLLLCCLGIVKGLLSQVLQQVRVKASSRPWGWLFACSELQRVRGQENLSLAHTTTTRQKRGGVSSPVFMYSGPDLLHPSHQGQLYSVAKVRCRVQGPLSSVLQLERG